MWGKLRSRNRARYICDSWDQLSAYGKAGVIVIMATARLRAWWQAHC